MHNLCIFQIRLNIQGHLLVYERVYEEERKSRTGDYRRGENKIRVR